jgi:hypothetical protein
MTLRSFARILIPVFALSLGLSLTGFAVESAEEAAKKAEQDYECGLDVAAEGTMLVDQYQTFLFNLLQSTRPTSDNVENAIKYYRYIEDSLNTEIGKIRGVAQSKTLGIGAQEYHYCQSTRDQYLILADAMLTEYVTQTASNKRTFVMVDALKELNANMEDYSNLFHSTFPVMFQKMDNALPCFARSCVHK